MILLITQILLLSLIKIRLVNTHALIKTYLYSLLFFTIMRWEVLKRHQRLKNNGSRSYLRRAIKLLESQALKDLSQANTGILIKTASISVFAVQNLYLSLILNLTLGVDGQVFSYLSILNP